jgi:hypothetical protein
MASFAACARLSGLHATSPRLRGEVKAERLR